MGLGKTTGWRRLSATPIPIHPQPLQPLLPFANRAVARTATRAARIADNLVQPELLGTRPVLSDSELAQPGHAYLSPPVFVGFRIPTSIRCAMRTRAGTHSANPRSVPRHVPGELDERSSL